MKIVDRYLGKTIIFTTSVVLMMLLGLISFISIVSEINDVGNGAYTMLSAFGYVALTLPYWLYTLFPIAILLGIILGLGLLGRSSELIVLRANGISLYRITASLIVTTLIMLTVAMSIGELIAPKARQYAENHKAQLITNGQALATQRGTWLREGHDFIYIKSMVDNKHLLGISRYQFDKNNALISTSYAKTAIYENKHWTMYDIATSFITPQGVTAKQTPVDNWPLSINPRLIHISITDPDEMSLKQLYDYSNYLKANHLNANIYSLVFWQRVLLPFTVFILAWLAIPFSFGHFRTAPVGVQMLLGVMVGFCFYILNQFFGPFTIVYQWPPFLAASVPIMLFAGLAFLLMRWVKQ